MVNRQVSGKSLITKVFLSLHLLRIMAMFFKAIVNFAKQKFNEDICGKTSKRPAKRAK